MKMISGKRKEHMLLTVWGACFHANGAAASLLTLARCASSGQPARLNLSPLITARQPRSLPPDMYSMHSQASELTSSSKTVWL